MLNSKIIGEKISKARKAKNLSQADLGNKISISPQAVGKWERGESLPDILMLNRLAAMLDVDLNYFSEGFNIETRLSSSEIVKDLNFTKPEWDMSNSSWADADFSGLKNLKDKFSSSNLKVHCVKLVL